MYYPNVYIYIYIYIYKYTYIYHQLDVYSRSLVLQEREKQRRESRMTETQHREKRGERKEKKETGARKGIWRQNNATPCVDMQKLGYSCNANVQDNSTFLILSSINIFQY